MLAKLENNADLDELEKGSTIGDYEQFFDEDFDFSAAGIAPSGPTEAKPGSDNKVLMLAARYAAGLPLWHNSDRYDHSPGDVDDDE